MTFAWRRARLRRGPRRRLAVRAGGLAALTIVALGSAGCGSTATSQAGSQLTVYSSLPLGATSGSLSTDLVNGEKLALAQAGGRVGRFEVSYVSLDDSNPLTGTWDPGATSGNAKTAAQDTTTIAYLGDYNSGASAVSLPLINEAGILQVSPSSPYVGLTSSLDAGQDEPDRFYPTGKRTFGRLAPGDQVQGPALVLAMQGLGVRRLYVISDQNPFQDALAQIVTGDARAAGISVVGHDSIDVSAQDFSTEVHKVVAAAPDAVFYAGGAGPGPLVLWHQLYAADPSLRLLGSSTLAGELFTSQLGPSASETYLASPTLAANLYPPVAQRFFRLFKRTFGYDAQPAALYGYEAMQVVLQAVRDAGSRGNDRQAVVNAFFRIRDRNSVLGRYSVLPSGDTTLSYFGLYRVAGGRPVFDRVLRVPAGAVTATSTGAAGG